MGQQRPGNLPSGAQTAGAPARPSRLLPACSKVGSLDGPAWAPPATYLERVSTASAQRTNPEADAAPFSLKREPSRGWKEQLRDAWRDEGQHPRPGVGSGQANAMLFQPCRKPAWPAVNQQQFTGLGRPEGVEGRERKTRPPPPQNRSWAIFSAIHPTHLLRVTMWALCKIPSAGGSCSCRWMAERHLGAPACTKRVMGLQGPSMHDIPPGVSGRSWELEGERLVSWTPRVQVQPPALGLWALRRDPGL